MTATVVWFRRDLRVHEHPAPAAGWVREPAALPGDTFHAPPPGSYLPPVVDLAEGRSRELGAYREAALSR